MKFADVLGQEEAKDRVREAVAQGRLPHALMLVGPQGVGKLALATAIASYVNCLNPQDGDSCGKCQHCTKIAKGIHPDLFYLLPVISKTEGNKQWLSEDFFSAFRSEFFQDPYLPFSQWQQILGGESKQLFISVHEIRELKRKIFLKAFEAPTKVVLIWQAETIREAAANAFLKLLEEPPERTLILLTCSDPSQLLATINSRVQRIRMGRVERPLVEAYLRDRKQLDPDLAEEFAAIAEGSPAIANEFLSESNQKMSLLFIDWLRAVYMGQYDKIQERIEPVLAESKEFQKLFLAVAVKKLRDSLLFHLGARSLALSTRAETEFQEKFSQLMTPEKVGLMGQLIEESQGQIAGNANPQLTFIALSLRMHSILRSGS